MPDRLRQAASATAGSDLGNLGTLTLTFPTPPTGVIWTGSFIIPTAEPYNKWSLVIAGQTIAQWQGSTPVGPIQVAASETISIVGSNLVPKESYSGYYIGTSDQDGSVPYVYPNTINPTAFQVPPELFSARMPVANQVQTGDIFVGNLQQILLNVRALSGAAGECWFVKVAWHNILFGVDIYVEDFCIDPMNTNNLIDYIPVKAQFVNITIQEIALNHTMTMNLDIVGMNFIDPHMAQFHGDQMFFQNTFTPIAAGASLAFAFFNNSSFYQGNYGSGLARMLIESTVKTWTARLQMFTRLATYVDIDGIDSHGTDLLGTATVVLPRSTPQLVVTNNGAASGNFTFSFVGT